MTEFPSVHRQDSSSTGLMFLRTYNRWHSEIKKQLKKIDITHPQFVVLTTIGYLIQEKAEITQVMIANLAGMDVMSLSQILVLLEKKGYIERRQHSKDTRANAIFLTPCGREKMIASLPIVEKIDELFFGSLGESEATFRLYLSKLKEYEFA